MSFCQVAGGTYASWPRVRFRFRTCTAFEFWRQWGDEPLPLGPVERGDERAEGHVLVGRPPLDRLPPPPGPRLRHLREPAAHVHWLEAPHAPGRIPCVARGIRGIPCGFRAWGGRKSEKMSKNCDYFPMQNREKM